MILSLFLILVYINEFLESGGKFVFNLSIVLIYNCELLENYQFM